MNATNKTQEVKMQITATVQEIRTGVAQVHDIDQDRLGAIRAAIEAGQDLGLPLVVEDNGNGALVLDGHHRLAARAALDQRTCLALVVSCADMDALIEAEFGGEFPSRLCDLDSYIMVDGKPYTRRDNGHE